MTTLKINQIPIEILQQEVGVYFSFEGKEDFIEKDISNFMSKVKNSELARLLKRSNNSG